MIDLMPHLGKYVRCLGTVVDKSRALYKPEYDDAFAADSDDVGHLLRFNVGHLLRFEAGRRSDLMSATISNVPEGRNG
jgi:hypothetical protein